MADNGLDTILKKTTGVVQGPDGRQYLKLSDLPPGMQQILGKMPGVQTGTLSAPTQPAPMASPSETRPSLGARAAALGGQAIDKTLGLAVGAVDKALQPGLNLLGLKAEMKRLDQTPEGRRAKLKVRMFDELERWPTDEELLTRHTAEEAQRKSGQAFEQGDDSAVMSYLRRTGGSLMEFMKNMAEEVGLDESVNMANEVSANAGEFYTQDIPTDPRKDVGRAIASGQRSALTDIWVGSKNIADPDFANVLAEAEARDKAIAEGQAPAGTFAGKLTQQVGQISGPMATGAVMQLAKAPGKVASFEFWRRQGKGMMLKAALKGVDLNQLSDIDKQELNEKANLVGSAYAAIEFLVQALPFEKVGIDPSKVLFRKYFNTLIKAAPKEKAVKWWAKNIAMRSVQHLARTGGETLEEGLQRTTMDVFQNEAQKIKNAKLPDSEKKKLIEFNEMVNNAANDMQESFLPLLVVAGGPAALKSAETDYDLRQITQGLTKEGGPAAGAEIADELTRRLTTGDRPGDFTSEELVGTLNEIKQERLKDIRRRVRDNVDKKRVSEKVEAYRKEYEKVLELKDQQAAVDFQREMKDLAEYGWITPEEVDQIIAGEKAQTEAEQAAAKAAEDDINKEKTYLDAIDKFLGGIQEEVNKLYDVVGNAGTAEEMDAVLARIQELETQAERITLGDITRDDLEFLAETGMLPEVVEQDQAPIPEIAEAEVPTADLEYTEEEIAAGAEPVVEPPPPVVAEQDFEDIDQPAVEPVIEPEAVVEPEPEPEPTPAPKQFSLR